MLSFEVLYIEQVAVELLRLACQISGFQDITRGGSYMIRGMHVT